MCILIVQKSEKLIEKETLKTCWDNNKDMAGIGFLLGNKFIVTKSSTFGNFYKKYESIQKKFPDIPKILHFRIATSGKINHENCHPFIFGDLMVAHNGIISGFGNESKSDTREFGEKYFSSTSFETIEKFRKVFEGFLGGSKIAVFSLEGDILILNEKAGFWVEGNWYSNRSYEPKKIHTYIPKVLRKELDYLKDKWEQVETKFCCQCGLELQYDFEKEREKCNACLDYLHRNRSLESKFF